MNLGVMITTVAGAAIGQLPGMGVIWALPLPVPSWVRLLLVARRDLT